MLRLPMLALATVLFLCCADANATPITYNVDFTATGSAVASASYTLTFDPTIAYEDATDGLTVNTFSGFTAPAATAFTYDPIHSGGMLIIGGLLNTVRSTYGNTNDYSVTFWGIQTTPSFVQFVAQSPARYTMSGTVKIAQASPVAITPEPSTISLLGMAVLAGAGAIRRRFCW